MTDLRQQLIAIKFKPVDGGYLYRAPYQLGIGKVSTYVINEQQKDELVDVVIPKRPWVRSFAIVGAVMAATLISGLAVFALSPHESPTATDTFALFALTAALSLAGFLVLRWWTYRQIKPILERLPLSDQAFTMADQRATMFKTMSTGMMAFVTGVMTFNGIMMLTSGFLSAGHGSVNGTSIASGSVSLAVAIYYGSQLIRRRRSVQA